MGIITSYIIKLVIISGLLHLYYHVALRNKKFHSYNRFYLLAAMVISIVLPLINFNWYNIKNTATPLVNMLAAINQSNITQPAVRVSTGTILFAFAAVVSVVLFAILISKIIWIYNIKRRHKNTHMHGFTLIETSIKQAPFSFLSNLFWKRGIELDDDSGKKILRHELTHITQKHTYDKLFAQILVCIFWINPFFWLMQKELGVIHEFIADSGCIEEGDTESFALMLLQAHNEGRYLDPSHAFFHSSIKRRLLMIATSNRTQYSYARRVIAVPFAMLVLAVFSVRVSNAQSDPKRDTSAVKVKDIVIENAAPGTHLNDSVKVVNLKLTLLRANRVDTLRINDVVVGPPVKNGKEHTGTGRVRIDDVRIAPAGNALHDDTARVMHAPVITILPAGYAIKQATGIIQNPPDVVYYVNGVETSRENIKSLDPKKVIIVNTWKGDDAVARHGEKCRNGMIEFTTK